MQSAFQKSFALKIIDLWMQSRFGLQSFASFGSISFTVDHLHFQIRAPSSRLP
jgi:hypothetical protein